MTDKPPAAPMSPDVKPIILVSYPKIILLYPTFFASILAAILTYFCTIETPHVAPADTENKTAAVETMPHIGPINNKTIAVTFLCLMTINMVVLAFDFPRTTSLIVFFVIVTIAMGLMLIWNNYPDLLPALGDMLKKITPLANSTFYACFATMLGLMYIGVFVKIRFDYWEVRPNELLHHHGFLSSLERYSAPNLRISKEIDDVFEYMLLRCGRLILHPSNEPRAHVLDNVLNIDAKEKAITQMLGALQVQIRDERTVSHD